MLNTYCVLCPADITHASREPWPFCRTGTRKEPHCNKYLSVTSCVPGFGRCQDKMSELCSAGPHYPCPTFPKLKACLPQTYSQGTLALPSQPNPISQLVCEPLQMLSCLSQMGGGSTDSAILRPPLLMAPHNCHPPASYLYGTHDYYPYAVHHCLVLPLHQANRGECCSLLSSAHFRRWYTLGP